MLLFVVAAGLGVPKSWVEGGGAVVSLISSTVRWEELCRAVLAFTAQVPRVCAGLYLGRGAASGLRLPTLLCVFSVSCASCRAV